MASVRRSDPSDDRPAFDEVIHSPIRLQVCAMLAETESLRFADLQSALGISDSHLSKNVRVLADAGLVAQSKQHAQSAERQRPVAVLTLTPEGRRSYRRHAAWLAQITHGAPPRDQT
ncbi:transcriptional regulator [Microbacterium marinilacus]|uniref:Transcriptional regulator n=1 Tax=Microbacterium marinilacus TaxID=415209 RepID=A0ABP7BSM5_9MICO|nr:transcriptional regulator [Microbacterium marinilacus]MBY0689060.1 transcriptional regulator [Microbacterium marinilacus]